LPLFSAGEFQKVKGKQMTLIKLEAKEGWVHINPVHVIAVVAITEGDIDYEKGLRSRLFLSEELDFRVRPTPDEIARELTGCGP
jgi:hypothetical protein